jgi:hypothetical protein
MHASLASRARADIAEKLTGLIILALEAVTAELLFAVRHADARSEFSEGSWFVVAFGETVTWNMAFGQSCQNSREKNIASRRVAHVHCTIFRAPALHLATLPPLARWETTRRSA